mmetsp:Transcript_3291/g.11933  ORF Transcript_3291/g.11933 Transcript_3291/m.11933 type:complete len:262 (+) Transcript_3291:455-1240(+)
MSLPSPPSLTSPPSLPSLPSSPQEAKARSTPLSSADAAACLTTCGSPQTAEPMRGGTTAATPLHRCTTPVLMRASSPPTETTYTRATAATQTPHTVVSTCLATRTHASPQTESIRKTKHNTTGNLPMRRASASTVAAISDVNRVRRRSVTSSAAAAARACCARVPLAAATSTFRVALLRRRTAPRDQSRVHPPSSDSSTMQWPASARTQTAAGTNTTATPVPIRFSQPMSFSSHASRARLHGVAAPHSSHSSSITRVADTE